MKKLFIILWCIILIGCGSRDQSAGTGGVDVAEPVVSESDSSEDMGGGMMGGGMMANLRQPKLKSDGRITNTDEREAKRALDVVLDLQKAQQFLSNYPDFTAEVWVNDDNTAWLDFYAEENGEWLASTGVDLRKKEVFDVNIPDVLSEAEYAKQSEGVVEFVMADGEVAALVGDPQDWYVETYFDGFENAWEVYFNREIEAWTVRVETWGDGEWHIDEVYDPRGMEAEQAAQWKRDQAIELTYEADGIWESVSDVEDWTTLVEQTGEEDVYTVSVISRQGEHFFAVVDVAEWEILETKR